LEGETEMRIEQNVPLAEFRPTKTELEKMLSQTYHGQGPLCIVADLKVGESVLFPGWNHFHLSWIEKWEKVGTGLGKEWFCNSELSFHPRKFTYRITDRGVRVWRIGYERVANDDMQEFEERVIKHSEDPSKPYPVERCCLDYEIGHCAPMEMGYAKSRRASYLAESAARAEKADINA
jgi:hypothetical protein